MKKLILIALLLIPTPALAIPVEWTLQKLAIADGDSLSGSFVYDAMTNTYWNVPIQTTGNITTFFNTIGGDPQQLLATNRPSPQGQTGALVLRLALDDLMTDAGGFVRKTEAGDRSPTYMRELERYARADGHFSWWDFRSIHEISYGALEDWSMWLADRGLAPKTRWNVMGAFRSFVGWLHRRGEIRTIPEFPWPRFDEHEPHLISAETQDQILSAIPEDRRGIFIALAYRGLRPSEARALDAADCRDGWLVVDKAVKGRRINDPIRGTKTRKGKRLPVPESLMDWIERHVPAQHRLEGRALFVNPRPRRRWGPTSLRRIWFAACAQVGVSGVSLYEGTKHSMATDAVRRGVPERSLQTFLGHADARSTRRYARLSEHALVSVLRPGFVGGLSVAENPSEKPFENEGFMVEAAGIEPASV